MPERNVEEILRDIRIAISQVETQGATPAALSSIDHDFHELLELLKLFLISERDTYYGYFLMNMRFECCFFESILAGIKLNENPPVFQSNPLILCKLSLQEILYVVCHEIEHVLLDHPAQMVLTCQGEDEETYYEFNLAADASVNDRLDAEILTMKKKAFMSAPEGVINSETLRKMRGLKTIKHLENYSYYFDLIHKKSKKKPKPEEGDHPASPGAEGVANNLAPESSPSSPKNPPLKDERGREVVTAASYKEMEDHGWGVDDAEEAHIASKVLIDQAIDAMGEETRGKMSGLFESAVAKMNRPPMISWERLFKKYVGTIPAGKRKTKMRLNRRQPSRYDLMGTVADKIIKVAVCIDTSASMSDAMISEVLNEIFAILSKRKKEVTIIECDYSVQDVYAISSPKDIHYRIHGRGGTAFTPAIEFVNQEKYFRDALLVYFTDGYGEEKIPKPLVNRVLWVILGKAEDLSVKQPYGDVVSFHPEEEL